MIGTKYFKNIINAQSAPERQLNIGLGVSASWSRTVLDPFVEHLVQQDTRYNRVWVSLCLGLPENSGENTPHSLSRCQTQKITYPR